MDLTMPFYEERFPDEALAVMTVEIEQLLLSLREVVSVELANSSVEIERASVIDGIVFKIRGYVWAEQLDAWTIKYPDDWWQAFKERWAPEWVLKRWPIVYMRHCVDIKALYPEYKVSLPDQRYRMMYTVT